MRKRITILVLALVIMGACLVQPVSAAAAYPTKPIEVIVPFTAGGTNDLMARLVAEVAKKYLGQPLVIVNKPGAGGSLGVAEALKAPATATNWSPSPATIFPPPSIPRRSPSSRPIWSPSPTSWPTATAWSSRGTPPTRP